MIDVDHIRAFALSLPEAHEEGHWGKPSFRVRNRIFASVGDDAGVLILKIPVDDQEVLLDAAPGAFVTNAWSKRGWLGARLDVIERGLLEELIEESWRRIAPKRAIQALAEERD
ncbi:MAG: MmcQ/YjbR family DNA-binding protein [Acidobacteriota bacterium]